MEKKKAIGFDLDGTIIKLIWYKAHKEWYKLFGILNKQDENVYNEYVLSKEWWNGVEKAISDFYYDIDLGEKIINKTARTFYGVLMLKELTKIMKIEGIEKILISEAIDMLKLSKNKEYANIIITNQPEIFVEGFTYLFNKEYNLIDDYFGSTEGEKPDKKRVWRKVLEKYNIVIYLSDTKDDLEIAKTFGIQTFLVPWSSEKSEGIEIINQKKLEEILNRS